MVKIIYVTTVPMALKYILLDQMKSLTRDGYLVVAASAPGDDAAALETASIDHIKIPALTRRFSVIQDIRATWQLYKMFRRERPDIVHSHTPKPIVISTIAAKASGIPTVISTIHGFYSNDLMRRGKRIIFSILEWVGLLLSDFAFFRSKDDLMRARSWPFIRESKLAVLTGGIDLTRFDPDQAILNEPARLRTELGIAEGDKVIGFVGRLVREKGVLDLLQAVPQIRKEVHDAHLILVGPKEGNESFDAVSRSLSITEACHFVGQRDDIENWYSMMDILVLPSYREGFPRTVMEASAMGVPVISTDVRGCRDAVLHQFNGLIVEAGNIPRLARTVTLVLQNREMGRTLGEAGRQLARDRFDQELEFETTRQLYQRLLAMSDGQ